MRKLVMVLAVLTIIGGIGLVGMVLAEGELPEHPHLLVLGLELDADENPIGFRKCVDLAANQALPLNSQHSHVHFGTAGLALFDKAGHVVVPADPFPGVPWSNCEELIAFFFP